MRGNWHAARILITVMNNLQHRNLLHVQVLHREWVSTLLHSSDDRINARGASKKTDLHSNINFDAYCICPRLFYSLLFINYPLYTPSPSSFWPLPVALGGGLFFALCLPACKKKRRKKKTAACVSPSILSLNNRYFSVLRTVGGKKM